MPEPRPGVSYGRKPRSDGRWQGYVALSGHRRRTVIRRTEAEMRAEVDRLAAQRDAGREPQTGDPTLAAYLTRWIEQRRDGDIGKRKLAPATVIRYEQLARLQIVPTLGTVRLSKLQAVHIDDVLSALRRGGASGTVRLQAYRLLHVALKHAERRGLVARNPCDLVEPPSRDAPRQREIDTDDVTAILQAARGHPHEAILWTAIGCGLRIGEVLNLRWEWIDLDAGRLRIVRKVQHLPGMGAVESDPKTTAGIRRLALPAVTVAALRAHRDAQAKRGRPNPKGLAFPTANGTHLRSSNWYRQVWDAWKRDAGVDPGTPFRQLTRKAHHSLLVTLGVDPETLRHRAGHTSATTTFEYYVETISGADDDAARRLDGALRRLASKKLRRRPDVKPGVKNSDFPGVRDA